MRYVWAVGFTYVAAAVAITTYAVVQAIMDILDDDIDTGDWANQFGGLNISYGDFVGDEWWTEAEAN